jgi:hypothetical protein
MKLTSWNHSRSPRYCQCSGCSGTILYERQYAGTILITVLSPRLAYRPDGSNLWMIETVNANRRMNLLVSRSDFSSTPPPEPVWYEDCATLLPQLHQQRPKASSTALYHNLKWPGTSTFAICLSNDCLLYLHEIYARHYEDSFEISSKVLSQADEPDEMQVQTQDRALGSCLPLPAKLMHATTPCTFASASEQI